MQNLGTEVSQLGSLLEMQLMNGSSLVNHSRVIIVHAVNIRPDLNLLSIEGCTYQ